MKPTMLLHRLLASWRLAAILILTGGIALAHPPPPVFVSSNLDSDIPGVAHETDPLCINPWGLVTGVEGNLHVSDESMGVSTLYDPFGDLIDFTGANHSITIPFVTGTSGAPTGVADNQQALLTTATDDFAITSGTSVGSSNFIYVTEDGVVAGFNNMVSGSSAITGTAVANAGFTGVSLSWTGTGTKLAELGHTLFVADFAQGTVDVFNNKWESVTPSAANPFVDPDLPSAPLGDAWSPFNIHTLDFNGKALESDAKNEIRHLLLVTYALHSTTINTLNDIPGPGNGYLAIFNTDGTFIKQLGGGGGELNSPWGIAVSHRPLGPFGAPIVVFVGSHGDGTINAYAIDPHFPDLDKHLGVVMKDDAGHPLTIEGLWGLRFATKKVTIAQYIAAEGADLVEDTKDFYFSAGILDESHGLVGKITVIP